MTQAERRSYLIKRLLAEQPEYAAIKVSGSPEGQKQLLRSLWNVRMPGQIGEDFLSVQDGYLQEETAQKGVASLSEMSPIVDGLYLWRGDITTLRCGAIVNAANSGMTGCYQPCHNCIDNCIHTYAGVQLRNYCNKLMRRQGYAEPAGQAKLTPAFNLPCDFIIHTVGPIVEGELTQEHCGLLVSCYHSCLELADSNAIPSIAFCCISTGVFRFPNQKAAEIAIQTVKAYKRKTASKIEVVFNVFQAEDEAIYRTLLCR